MYTFFSLADLSEALLHCCCGHSFCRGIPGAALQQEKDDKERSNSQILIQSHRLGRGWLAQKDTWPKQQLCVESGISCLNVAAAAAAGEEGRTLSNSGRQWSLSADPSPALPPSPPCSAVNPHPTCCTLNAQYLALCISPRRARLQYLVCNVHGTGRSVK